MFLAMTSIRLLHVTVILAFAINCFWIRLEMFTTYECANTVMLFMWCQFQMHDYNCLFVHQYDAEMTDVVKSAAYETGKTFFFVTFDEGLLSADHSAYVDYWCKALFNIPYIWNVLLLSFFNPLLLTLKTRQIQCIIIIDSSKIKNTNISSQLAFIYL